MNFLFSFIFCFLAVSPDRSASSFKMREVRYHVDQFDFSGEYPQLEHIDIDARKKKRVEFDLSGRYPLLKEINYEGSFGSLKGELTGDFPLLTLVNFLCTNCAMDMDLKGEWKKSCTINIRGMEESITLKLPKDVGVIVHTKVGLKGRVFHDDLKKKGWWKVFNKTYKNPLAETADVVLTLNVETTDGHIILQ